MRMSELSDTTGVPVATLKYYLREGLLPPGRQTAPNQATYDDEHVHHVRLVRVLRDVGGLSIDAIREVITAIEDPARSLHAVLGSAHRALARDAEEPAPEPERREIDVWLDDELHWQVGADAPDRNELARALASLRRLGRDVAARSFSRYAQVAEDLAALEVASLDNAASPQEAVEEAVVVTVVYEAVLTALRRLAQEHASATR